MTFFPLWLSLCFLATALIWPADAEAQSVEIEGLRFGVQQKGTRIVLDLNKGQKPDIFFLPNPNRVVLDFKDTLWLAKKTGHKAGLVDGFRHGLFDQKTYRIVFDLKQPAIIKRSFLLPPSKKYSHRYVLDLVPASQADFALAVKATKNAIPQRVSRLEREAVPPNASGLQGLPLIVLDAGHGGPDPGAPGALGVSEKHITLNIAKEIKEQLEKTGRYRVKLTRSSDFFIPVRERFEIARKWKADVFISIHADSIVDPEVRGGTVYTLSETASDKEAARLAARENKSDLIAGVDLDTTDDDVSSILIELAQRETMNVSAQFAEILLPEMRREVKVHKRGHRYANLGVLKAPDIPSLLIETGYLSNKQDAAVLDSSKGRLKIAIAVQRGVDKFFEQRLALSR